MVHIPFWLSNRLRLLGQYGAVFIAAIPVALLYALFIQKFGNNNLVLAGVVCIATLSGHFAWKFLEKDPVTVNTIAESNFLSGASSRFVLPEEALAGAIALAVFTTCVTPLAPVAHIPESRPRVSSSSDTIVAH